MDEPDEYAGELDFDLEQDPVDCGPPRGPEDNGSKATINPTVAGGPVQGDPQSPASGPPPES